MLKFASTVGLTLLLADLKRRIHHWVRSGIMGAIGALFAIFALAFLLVALHLFLSGLLNPIASAAIIGVVLLIVALVFFYVASRPMRPAASTGGEPMTDSLRDGMARLNESGIAASLFRHPLFPTAAAALLAGIFLGRRSKRDKD
jgi:hypothetical protein